MTIRTRLPLVFIATAAMLTLSSTGCAKVYDAIARATITQAVKTMFPSGRIA